jgi:hypothetical protein
MKQRLLNHEKRVMKAMEKRLPISAFCSLDFSREVFWSEAMLAIGMRPKIRNELRLYVNIPREGSDAESDTFSWKGAKLEAGIKSLDTWLRQRRQLSCSQVKMLPAVALGEVTA